LLQEPPGAGAAGHILFPSRFDPLKRQALAVNAMRHVRSDVRLILVGTGVELPAIRKRIEEVGLGDRIEIRVGIPDDELIALCRDALAVYFGPFDEDYGYVTIEAFLSGKPVMTASDSGGPLEFVEDGVSGLVAAPEPGALGDAIDRLFALPEAKLAGLGEEGRRRVASITWDAVVDRLTELVR
jgi:glycosyltransferase involved in cell wall biosynthesis